MTTEKSRVADIQMVDVKGQYRRHQTEIDNAILDTVRSGAFINGPQVRSFQANLAAYLDAKWVIPCGNGTDALQIALMALELAPGDEVIVPAFTYVATAEVIALLGLKPVMVDVCPDTFNLTQEIVEAAITPRTKAIIPVHLFGQCTDMEPIVALAQKHNFYVIEDNAQAIGSEYTFSTGEVVKSGTIGHIGCTSFYPSKNLGCYGDGGAIFTQDEILGKRLKMIANHGQEKRYYHARIGVNSRLDAIQAAILNVKLKQLDDYTQRRQVVARYYDTVFNEITGLKTPTRHPKSTHVFHQYTLQVDPRLRNGLQAQLKEQHIPSMIYYPVPLYKQKAFRHLVPDNIYLPVTEQLCQSVISLPIHTEMEESQLNYITTSVVNALR